MKKKTTNPGKNTQKAAIRIRPAEIADLPSALALENATFTAHAISARQMRYLQKQPTAVFLVATKKKELVGDGIGLLRRHAGGIISGRIYSVVVDPNHRGERIGQKLMLALLDHLKRRGVTRISLEVDQANLPAIGLYERLGFKTDRHLKHFYGHKKHGVRMLLDLSTKL